MYVLKRVALILLVFLVAEGLFSLVWILAHGADRAVLSEAAPRIERVRDEIARERAWLEERLRLGEAIDREADRLRAGAGSFDSLEGYEAARATQADRVSEWNERLEEHQRRARTADSLAAVHDSLVQAYEAAYRRAYPGWVLLPRPAPPEHVSTAGPP